MPANAAMNTMPDLMVFRMGFSFRRLFGFSDCQSIAPDPAAKPSSATNKNTGFRHKMVQVVATAIGFGNNNQGCQPNHGCG